MPEKLIIITNLYPLPWQPTRATFNYQQFSLLAEHYDVAIVVPVAFPDWIKHRRNIDNNDANLKIIPYFYLPKFGRRFYSLFMYWSLKLFAGKWLKQQKPNKILASWAFPDAVAAAKIAKQLRASFFLKVHGSDINMHATFPARAKQIVTMANQANGILSVSQDLANKMIAIGVNPEKIRVIYNGVNLAKFTINNAPVEQENIVFVGNLKHDKGVMELLEAFAEVNIDQPNLRLIYVGSGVMLNALKARVKSLKLENNVEFMGVKQHDELPSIMSQATLVALPSYNEGVPNVLLEAMACGVPVVATPVGGIPEVVNQHTGVLSTDLSAQSVAVALRHALSNDWDKQAIRQHAEQFNWPRNIMQFNALLNQESI